MSDFNIPRVGPSTDAQEIARQKLEAHQRLQQSQMRQIEAKREFKEWAQEGFNPVQIRKRFKKIEKQKVAALKKSASGTEEDSKKVEETQKIDNAASRFEKKNEELQAKTLKILRSTIKGDDTAEDILKKVLDFYPDHSLADEALDFLLETTSGGLREEVQQAKDNLNNNFGREVRAGRNMGEESRAFSKEGLGSATGLRDLYRDITGNRREPISLFDELSSKFSFDKMTKVTDFLLHSLGADMKAKGPSISRGELTRLLEDTRTLQAILGVYRFFDSRMPLIHQQFQMQDLFFPAFINFETLAKQFMGLVSERYPTSDRVMQISQILGISEELAAQVVIFMQFRDAIRQIAPKLFRSDDHRDELLEAILEALEELDDELEEQDDEEDDE